MMQISICEGMTKEFATPVLFAKHVVGKVNLIARSAKWAGARIFDADWLDLAGAQCLLVVVEPADTGEITAAAVSAFIREKRKAAA